MEKLLHIPTTFSQLEARARDLKQVTWSGNLSKFTRLKYVVYPKTYYRCRICLLFLWIFKFSYLRKLFLEKKLKGTWLACM